MQKGLFEVLPAPMLAPEFAVDAEGGEVDGEGTKEEKAGAEGTKKETEDLKLAPAPPPPASLIALHALRDALPTAASSLGSPTKPDQAPEGDPESGTQPRSAAQHTLEALTDLTGYIAAQTYTYAGASVGVGSAPSPEEEEVRREIRALKGLVLNR